MLLAALRIRFPQFTSVSDAPTITAKRRYAQWCAKIEVDCFATKLATLPGTPKIQFGAELVHQTPDAKAARATTGLGAGVRYDFNENYHLLAYAGPGLQNAVETDRYSWYVSILFTF